MKEFVNYIFHEKDKKVIVSTYRNAYLSLSKSKRSTDVSFSKDELIEVIEVIIANSFVIYNKCIYRQIVGTREHGNKLCPTSCQYFLFMYELTYKI